MNKTNAKKELLLVLCLNNTNKNGIKCAKVEFFDDKLDNDTYILKENYTEESLNQFLNDLDFDYNSGYGSQKLFGLIWLKDEGTWLSKGEYGGSKWYKYNKVPEIPKELL